MTSTYHEFVMQVGWNENVDAMRLQDGVQCNEVHILLRRPSVPACSLWDSELHSIFSISISSSLFPLLFGPWFGLWLWSRRVRDGWRILLPVSRMINRCARSGHRCLRCVVMHFKTLHCSWNGVWWGRSRESNSRGWDTRFTPLNIHWVTFSHSKLKFCLPVINWSIGGRQNCWGWGAVREKGTVEEVEDIMCPGITGEEVLVIEVVVSEIRDARFVPSFFQELGITREDKYGLMI